MADAREDRRPTDVDDRLSGGVPRGVTQPVIEASDIDHPKRCERLKQSSQVLTHRFRYAEPGISGTLNDVADLAGT